MPSSASPTVIEKIDEILVAVAALSAKLDALSMALAASGRAQSDTQAAVLQTQSRIG